MTGGVALGHPPVGERQQSYSQDVPNIEADDLIDASEVAPIIGVASSNAVSVYRSRYLDFPAPFVEKSSGKCVLWLRTDIIAWAAGRQRQ